MNINFHGLRVRLRPLSYQDQEWVLALQQDPQWVKFIGSRAVNTREDACDYIARTNAQREEWGYGLLAIEDIKTDLPLGVCGLFNRFAFTCPDLGFALLPEARGRGICQEACELVIQWARSQGYSFLTGMTHPDNTRSQALLTKLGYEKQGWYFDKSYPVQALYWLSL